MTGDREAPPGRRSVRHSVAGAVTGAVSGAVTRVGDRLGESVGDRVESASRSVVDDMEPYLTEVTIPRVVDALVPHLVENVAPVVMDGVSDHLATVTIPAVVEGMIPQLVEQMLPEILDRLRPYLAEELVPELLADLTPHLVAETAPRVITGVLPMIRAEVVPAVLDDIVDDPKVRDLIREQSQGLLLDALERVRAVLARGDDVVEGLIRRVRRSGPAPVEDPSVLPAGRARSHAGVVARGVALGIDLAAVSFVAGQGLAALLALVGSLVDPIPAWFVAGATAVSVSLAPVYFALSWWLSGRTVGAVIAGFEVCDQNGSPVRLTRSVVRALLLVMALAIWAIGMVRSGVDVQRRGWLDTLTRTRTPYKVHEPVRPSGTPG